ncbi:restriction endonuclease subunit S [Vibrio sp. 10N.261.46.A3]|uniref:restriction endonuclease subunit S n=1 Tax=Vibrio sp. 10N.261.46.A3 TaxID=3229658 RepID=UPI00354DD880
MSDNYSFEILHWEKNFGKPIESWTYLPIENLIKERKDSRVNDGSLKLCSLTIEDGVVEKSERYNREFLLKNQKENKYKCVHPNDIVINPMNLRFGAISKSEHSEPVLVSGYYNVVSASKLVDTDYLNSFLKSTAMNYMYERVALGTLNEKKRVHLSELKKIVVPIPTISEQLKIGQILSTWDKVITITEKLIETSKQQKKALMQQLLTGNKRLVNPKTGKVFEGEWEELHLKDICEVNPKKAKEPENGLVSFVPMDAVSEDAKLLRTDEKPYSEVSKGFTSFKDLDTLIAKITPCFENGKGALVNHLENGIGFGSTEFHVLRAKQGNAPDFVYYLTTTSAFRVRGEMNMQGSAGQKRVTTDYLKLYKVVVPKELNEQKKIASVLTAADKEIEVLEAKLAHFKQEKKALVQQLLTGKRRVNAEKQTEVAV